MLSISVALWFAPLLVIVWKLGSEHTLVREGMFFSKAAMVTFGGAYAVLPYVSQEAVGNFHWLNAAQMLDGLGLAETTPGPLIMVLQFVGFLGGWNQPGNLQPLFAATLGSAITTWTTFVPCFLWIFLGAPYIEQLRGNVKLTTALTAVTAAVVLYFTAVYDLAVPRLVAMAAFIALVRAMMAVEFYRRSNRSLLLQVLAGVLCFSALLPLCFAVGVTTLAALYPARRAAQIHPIEALRYG